MASDTLGQVNSDTPAELRSAASRTHSGDRPTTTVRTLISWFGQKRRGSAVNPMIRRALTALGVSTEPPFEDEWIDANIDFVLLRPSVPDGGPPRPAAPDDLTPSPQATTPANLPTLTPDLAEPGTLPAGQLLPGVDPAVKVSHLPAANKPPVRIAKEKPLTEAVTIMLSHDYSQLPVMSNDRDVVGMVSWKSIGRLQALGKAPKSVMDAMDRVVRIVWRNDSFYGAVQEVVAHDVVLVRSDVDRKICGILTAADVSSHFRTLAEPFLLIGEIERSLRRIIISRLELQMLSAVKDPSDTKRVIATVDDLTFGECVRLLEDPSRWARLKTTLDRGVVIERLKTINSLRNDVMHFDPDNTAPDDVETIRRVAEFLLRWVEELDA